MFRVVVSGSCGCFTQSGEAKTKEFETKEEALAQANAMVSKMNEEFCQKHEFSFAEYGKDVIIGVKRKR